MSLAQDIDSAFGALNLRIQQLEEECEKAKKIEHAYRKLLWLTHFHDGLYGDDGEMQCGECMRFGCIDYLRAPIELVEQAAHLAKRARLAKVFETKEETA